MAKSPYGGFGFEVENDPPWTKLATIQEHLEDGERLPPALARWLGEAIKRANNDPVALLVGLGLRKPKGRPSAWDRPGSKEALLRLWDLVSDGMADDAAIAQVQEEFPATDGEDRFSRPTLQRWLADVRQAEHEKWED